MIWSFLMQLQLVYSKSSCKNTLGNSYQPTYRHYCIMSNEIYWNYAPNSTANHMDLTNMFEHNAESILTQSELSMGSTFLKAVYQEYEYDTTTKLCDWTTLKTVTTSPKSNGILGPTIRAVVGDKIYVHYFNGCTRPYSIEPHGLYHSQVSSFSTFLLSLTHKLSLYL
jgi:hephaestin